MSDNEDDILHDSDDNDFIDDNNDLDSDDDNYNSKPAENNNELLDIEDEDFKQDPVIVDPDDGDDADEDENIVIGDEYENDEDQTNLNNNIGNISLGEDIPNEEQDDYLFGQNQDMDYNDEDDEDEDDEDDENYLQKFDSEIKKNYITDYHPECFIQNNEEITALAKVIRDKDNIIIDPLHRTIPYLTKYERARVLGQRAKQINSGARPFVKVPDTIIDGYLIAELELVQKRIPFIIRRPLPGNSGSEYWNLKDLEIISF